MNRLDPLFTKDPRIVVKIGTSISIVTAEAKGIFWSV